MKVTVVAGLFAKGDMDINHRQIYQLVPFFLPGFIYEVVGKIRLQ